MTFLLGSYYNLTRSKNCSPKAYCMCLWLLQLNESLFFWRFLMRRCWGGRIVTFTESLREVAKVIIFGVLKKKKCFEFYCYFMITIEKIQIFAKQWFKEIKVQNSFVKICSQAFYKSICGAHGIYLDCTNVLFIN